jgi:hypothetical protein
VGNLQAVYYQDSHGHEPVRHQIEQLQPKAQDSILDTIDLLNDRTDESPELGYPYTSGLKGKHYRAFRELRVAYGKSMWWIIFRRSERLFVLLHMVSHNQRDEIPDADKAIALRHWEDMKRRMGEEPRRPPRALGSDAP